MAGHRDFNELAQKLDKKPGAEKRRAEAEAKLRAELDAYAEGLGQLRRARSLTQQQLAQIMGVSQAQVSRIENETDMYLSTLQSYLEAMGGELHLVGVFEGERVAFDLGELTSSGSFAGELSPANLRAAFEAFSGHVGRADWGRENLLITPRPVGSDPSGEQSPRRRARSRRSSRAKSDK
jgi:transcriptional regulator with XRE-family HTH domain